MISQHDQRLENARQRARRVLRRFRKYGAENIIEAITEAHGIEIVSAHLEGADAQFIRIGNKITIQISDRITDPLARRFTIAHELGHLVLGHPTQVPSRTHSPGARGASIHELEANAFAAELLMPEYLLREKFDLSLADLQVPKQISAQCRVSILASAIRFVELAREPCAAVFSVATKNGQGKVRWVASTPRFDFDYRITRGRPLSPETIASGFFVAGAVVAERRRVPPLAWFDAHPSKAEVFEHAVCSHEFRTVLSMVWVRQDAA
jgi:Zn-dependent peptidase ImmA (M78 family)